MGSKRLCSKTACRRLAVATLTYNYGESTVVVGPLSQRAEPHAYDICAEHSRMMNAPIGWELLRIGEFDDDAEDDPDDLLAIANALTRPDTPEPELEPDVSSTAGPGTPRVDRSVESTSDSSNAPAIDTRRPEPLSPNGPARPHRGDVPTLRVVRH